jgi:DNA-binding MarR family transcriptional regulator
MDNGGAARDELIVALRTFATERDRLEEAIARRHGISHADLRALDQLSLHEGLTPGRLGERMMLSSGAVTALADRLERLGWLTREPHPSDRRSTLLKLTTKAQEAAEEIFGPYAEELSAAAAGLSSRERESCRAFLRRAAEISERHALRQASEVEVAADPG